MDADKLGNERQQTNSSSGRVAGMLLHGSSVLKRSGGIALKGWASSLILAEGNDGIYLGLDGRRDVVGQRLGETSGERCAIGLSGSLAIADASGSSRSKPTGCSAATGLHHRPPGQGTRRVPSYRDCCDIHFPVSTQIERRVQQDSSQVRRRRGTLAVQRELVQQ